MLLQPVAEGQVLLGHRVQVERRVLLERPQREALGLHRRDDLLLQDLLVEQVLHADAQARRLVGVAGADPAAGGADLQLAQLRLAGRVEQQVVGHDQVRVGRDAQPAQRRPAARAGRRAPRSAPAGRSRRRCRSRSACRGRGSPRGSGGASTPRSPRTIVWPALLPPWKRTTASPCSASRSVILPLPSSPHWAPTMTIPGMAVQFRGAAGLSRPLRSDARLRGRGYSRRSSSPYSGIGHRRSRPAARRSARRVARPARRASGSSWPRSPARPRSGR